MEVGRSRSPSPSDPGRRPNLSLSNADSTEDVPMVDAVHPHPEGVTAEPSEILGVFGLHPAVTEADLRKTFSMYGQLKKCTVVFNPRERRSRGFGFVTFETLEEAQRALEETRDGKLVLLGRPVRVDYSRTKGGHERTPGQYLGKSTYREYRPASRYNYAELRDYRRDDRYDYDRRSYRDDRRYDMDDRYGYDRYSGDYYRGREVRYRTSQVYR